MAHDSSVVFPDAERGVDQGAVMPYESEMAAAFIAIDASGLKAVDLAVHRARFAVSNLHYDSESATLTMIFEHFRPKDATIVRRGWMRWNVDWRLRSYRLDFANIESIEIRDESEVGYYEIDSIEWDQRASLLTIVAVPRLRIEARCEKLTLTVLTSINVTRTIRRHAFGLSAARVLGEDYLSTS